MAMLKLSACLAAGCTAVLKPSEITPLSALAFARIIGQSGLPNGVVNFVTGDGSTGVPLVNHPLVAKVSFTGSFLTGSRIMASASESVKTVTMELGGKGSFIAFEDVDIETVVEWILCSIYWNCGQICSATSRLVIHRSIKDKVVSRLVEEANKIVIGNGLNSSTKMGPIVSKNQYEKVKRYIEIGVKQGATLLCGGIPEESSENKGYFIRPTIFDNVKRDMTVWNEEIFGPVLMVHAFDTEEEAIQIANDSIYGLACSVFSKDESRCQRVTEKLRMGIVWINTAQPAPKELCWGGIKQSGFGREGGEFGVNAFLSVKQVTKWHKDNKDSSFKWFNSRL